MALQNFAKKNGLFVQHAKIKLAKTPAYPESSITSKRVQGRPALMGKDIPN